MTVEYITMESCRFLRYSLVLNEEVTISHYILYPRLSMKIRMILFELLKRLELLCGAQYRMISKY